MADKKIVEVKEVSIGKTRLFRKREPIVVLTPQAVIDSCEDAPLSITITPMTHREADSRDRLKKKIPVANRIANQRVGISVKMVTNYAKEFAEIERTDYATSEDNLEDLEKFQDKWVDFIDKMDLKDLSGIEEAEDNLLLSSVRCVADNCVGLTFEDGEVVEIGNESIDEIHPDLFYWILTSIENESYLTSGEVLGFQ